METPALDYILEGLEAALELSRELGVRSFPCDRSLLTESVRPPAETVPRADCGGQSQRTPPPRTTAPKPAPVTNAPDAPRLVFLHDRPLSAAGIEMMAKILAALHLTTEAAPIVVAPPVPFARVTIVLGGLALRKYFPEIKAGPGQWTELSDGRHVLVTYSPEYILRFKAVTADVRTIKQNMWQSLKAAVQRLH